MGSRESKSEKPKKLTKRNLKLTKRKLKIVKSKNLKKIIKKLFGSHCFARRFNVHKYNLINYKF